MGRKRPPGLIKRAGIWHIDKQVKRQRIRQSTGTGDLCEAELYLARLLDQTRNALIYGVRPPRSFKQAAAKFVRENQHKRSLHSDVGRLKLLMPWIGDLSLNKLHMGALRPWVEYRQRQGAAARTINHGLKVVRRIVNLAASEWVDENGLTWLEAAPKIKLLEDRNKRKPCPLKWDQQRSLLKLLPDHLGKMALFKVNTGCRDREVCNLRWEWEIPVPELETSVFIIPAEYVKNGYDRLVVLNCIALSVVNKQRGEHPTHVFVYEGKPIARMMNSAWLRARKEIGLPQLRVHDLKHTFGHRLRAVGVTEEDRRDLLGHKSNRMTTHYSAAELSKLIEAANSVCNDIGSKPELVVLSGSSII